MRPFILLFVLISFTTFAFAQEDLDTTIADTVEEFEENPTFEDVEAGELEYTLDEGADAKGFSLASPYHTVYTSLAYMQQENWRPDSAALTLFMDPWDQKRAERIIKKLKEYLDGSGHYIDLDAIPRDSFYVDSTGQPVYVLIPDVPEIFLYRKKGNWYYSRSTVNSIERLHRDLFPFGSFEWIPTWGQKKLWSLKVWQWLGILAFFLLGWLILKIMTSVLGGLLDRILTRVLKKEFDRTVFNGVARPTSLLIITILLTYVVPSLQFPVEANQYVMMVLKVLIPIFSVFVAYQLVDIAAEYMVSAAEKTESTLDDQLIPLVRKVLKGIVILVGLIFVLTYLGVDVTALLAGVSIGGLALALAAQDTVKNFFGSLMIFLDRPFQVGDWVDTGTHSGAVEEVGVRSTRIRTFNDSVVTVPNAHFADAAINNLGMRIYRRYATDIGVTYDTPPDLLDSFIQGLRKIALKHPRVVDENIEIHFKALGDSALVIYFAVFLQVPGWSAELRAKHQLLFAIVRLAEKLGVSFAFPTQTLHVENFPEKQSLTPTYTTTVDQQSEAINEFIDGWEPEVLDPRELPTKKG